MLSPDAIVIDSKPKCLLVSDWTLRLVSKEDEEDSGWRFQAIIKNDSSSDLTDLEYGLRYFDSAGAFLGVDEGFSLGTGDLRRREDKAISVSLEIPAMATHGVFVVRAEQTNFFQKHNFLLLGAAILISSIFFFLANLFF